MISSARKLHTHPVAYAIADRIELQAEAKRAEAFSAQAVSQSAFGLSLAARRVANPLLDLLRF